MEVLVTGATGLVGGNVVRALLGAGHGVSALVRNAGRAGQLKDRGVRLHEGDMHEPLSYRPLVERVEAVVHAAQHAPGSKRLGRRAIGQIQTADAVMTEALGDACAEHGRRLVYTSGCFNYGDHGDRWIDEQTPFDPSPLGVGHAREVTALLRRHGADGLDVVIVAPGFVYGPGGLFKASFYDQLEQGRLRVIGRGDNYWSPVHVDDLAAAYVAALERGQAGETYNVVDDAPLRLRELVDRLTAALDRERVGNVNAVLIGALIGRPLVRSLVTSFRIRNAKAKRALGWVPRYPSFADGLPSVLEALRRPG